MSQYTQSRQLSSQFTQNVPTGGDSAFKKRLNSFMADSTVSTPAPVNDTPDPPSMNELMKQAKDKKKVAKVNSDFKKRMKDMGY